MFDWAREAETLTEVIYAAMDGMVYFIDLETGNRTRNDLNLGFTFKGGGALDPRGYPILYLGAGYHSARGQARVFIVNLLDFTVMYEFGHNDGFALRNLSFFDAAPLIHAETDRLIYPGENGILYIIRLNTNFDPVAGTLSINPTETIRWRYNGIRSNVNGQFWLGIENSPVIWRGHLIMADNGGHLMCLDLNTLTLNWVQDVLDDTNSSPVMELEDGHPFIYIGTSFRAGWRAPADASTNVPVWKIDAVTGEIVWQVDFECFTVPEISGGVQSTIALGKNDLSDLIFVSIARTPGRSSGLLVALDKATGDIVWERRTQMFSWSSPVTIYDSDGRGFVIFCAGGFMYLFDGRTGDVLDFIDLGGHVEATPVVYNNTVVIGTRGQLIWGIRLT